MSRLPRRESRPGEVGRARDRPLAVDAGRSARPRDRGRARIHCRQARQRPDRGRLVRDEAAHPDATSRPSAATPTELCDRSRSTRTKARPCTTPRPGVEHARGRAARRPASSSSSPTETRRGATPRSSDAIAAASKAGTAVYVVAIESPKFNPEPLRKLAAATGGAYRGTSLERALSAEYAAIAAELRRTWRLDYADHRPARRTGDPARLTGHGSASRRCLELPASLGRTVSIRSRRTCFPTSSTRPCSGRS